MSEQGEGSRGWERPSVAERTSVRQGTLHGGAGCCVRASEGASVEAESDLEAAEIIRYQAQRPGWEGGREEAEEQPNSRSLLRVETLQLAEGLNVAVEKAG